MSKSRRTFAIPLLLAYGLAVTSFTPAAHARFISPDTLDPVLPGVGTNRYAYEMNDPVNLSDPSGHFAVLGAIVGAVAGVAV